MRKKQQEICRKSENADLTAELLLEEIKLLCKDNFVAVVRKKGDGIELKFLNGAVFTVAVWETSRN